jgi:hypothetical protein
MNEEFAARRGPNGERIESPYPPEWGPVPSTVEARTRWAVAAIRAGVGMSSRQVTRQINRRRLRLLELRRRWFGFE